MIPLLAVWSSIAVMVALWALVIGVAVLAVLWLIGFWSPRRTHARRAAAGKGRSLDELAERLDYTTDELRRFEPRYRAVAIPKKRGGHRRLLVPDDRTKELQRTILRRVLHGLRSHPAATGFERGLSIVENALPHAHKAIVVNVDIVDFFPCTRADRVDHYFRIVGWDAESAALLTRVVTHEDGLPQGAPTSPRLANLVNRPLDRSLARYAARRGADYTRYADDITFSFRRDTRGSAKKVRGILQLTRRRLRPLGYRLHPGKTTIRRRHQRQEVTGLVVNDGVRLPREVRRRLRAIRHHVATGREATLTEEQLRGWTAFETMVSNRAAGPDAGD